MTRIALIGAALMIVSGFARAYRPNGECMMCGPPLLPGAYTVSAQQVDSMYVVGVYDPGRDPALDLEAAIVRATVENRRILILVGGEWCIWCHILDDYVKSEKEIASELRASFLIVKVNFSQDNRNEAFLSKYPAVSGYPHMFVLDRSGALLHSQDTSELEDGRSYSRSAILGFLRKWAP